MVYTCNKSKKHNNRAYSFIPDEIKSSTLHILSKSSIWFEAIYIIYIYIKGVTVDRDGVIECSIYLLIHSLLKYPFRVLSFQ